MVPIRKLMCPSAQYRLKCPYTRTPTRIVVHNTANDATAVNEVLYMTGNPKEISFHYAVDDKEIVQGIPDNRNAWASGDGHGVGNMQGIHIEICYSKSGGERFIKAEKNAAEFIASLLKQYHWGMDKITKHQDYDGKYCPHRTLDMGWQRFLNMVKSYYEEDDEMLTYEQFVAYMDRYNKEKSAKGESGWAKAAINYCKDKGIMNGDTDGKFRPQDNVTRQELAQTIMNYDKKHN